MTELEGDERRLRDESGREYVVVDRRGPRRKVFGLSAWQWAVIGAWLVLIVGGTALGTVSVTASRNAKRLNRSLCAQVVYLDGIQSPSREQQQRIDKLVNELRDLQHCPPPPPPIAAPSG